MKNAPEPATLADQMTLKAVELLNRDIFGPVEEDRVTIRGARFRTTGNLKIETGFTGDGAHFTGAHPSRDFRDMFEEAWTRAKARKVERLLEEAAASLANEEFEAEQARRAAAAAGMFLLTAEQERRNARGAIVWPIAYALILAAIGAGVIYYFNTRDAAGAPAIAEEDRLNAFGFRKGDFPSTRAWQYPAGCFPDDNRFTSLPDCKANLERWESEGAVWVEWPEAGEVSP